MERIILKPGREKSLLRRHPWIFSGAIEKTIGNPGFGETVQVCDSRGDFQALGAYSPKSQIRIRIWSWDQSDKIDPSFFRSRLHSAISLRRALVDQDYLPTTDNHGKEGEIEAPQLAIRLVNAESDQLPGLIVDKYGNVLVMQVLSAGMEYWRETITELLQELAPSASIFERSDAEVRGLEGLPSRIGPVKGNPPESLTIEENGLRFTVSLMTGHKTGFYLDQKPNRGFIQSISGGKAVLDCFSYTGGFALNALKGGAKSVVGIDISRDALEIAEINRRLNQLPAGKVRWVEADVFQQLRKFRDSNEQFDLVILDPPKFAPTSSQVQKASRGYKDINLLAFKLLRPGGLLATYSCSGGVNLALFQKIVADAALDAKVNARILRYFFQAPDHPVSLNFPEGAYLKGLLLKID